MLKEPTLKLIAVVFLIGCIFQLTSQCSKKTPVENLFDAASNGAAQECERLVKGGVPVNATDNDGDTALDWAVYNQQTDVVRKLVELGADVNHTDQRGTTPLMYVATPFRGKGYYPDTMAARNQIAQYLIEHGADVNRVGPVGQTVLHFVVNENNPDLIRILLAAGIDKDIKSDQGYTARFLAKSRGYEAAVDALDGK